MSESVEEPIRSFALDARLPSVAHIGGETTLYTSWFGGTHWPASLEAAESAGFSVVTDPNRAGTAYASLWGVALYVTENAGLSWRELSTTGLRGLLAVAPGSPDVLWATDGGGLLRSVDRGQTWALAGNFRYPCCLASAALSAEEIYVLFSDRLFYTNDGGATLRELERGSLGHLDTFALDRSNPSVMYLASGSDIQPGISGLRMSTDGGSSWTTPSERFSRALVPHVAVSPVDGRLYLVERIDTGTSSYRHVLHVSSDGGTTFVEAGEGLGDEHILAVHPHPQLRCVVYVRSERGIYRSLNAGGTC